jgi:hypothetical protein
VNDAGVSIDTAARRWHRRPKVEEAITGVNVRRVPAAVRNKLGDVATEGLVEWLDEQRQESSDQVLSISADRFERRLTDEIHSVRVDLAQLEARLRRELHEGLATVRQELAGTRIEFLKWSFLFWVGQVAAVAGLLAFMLRGLP